MLKRLPFSSLRVVPAVILFSTFLWSLQSCSTGATAVTDYRSLVSPEDGMVIQLDLGRLNDKIDIEAITSHPSFEPLLQIGGAGASSSFFKYLQSSGLNTKAPVIMSLSSMTSNPNVRIFAELESEEMLLDAIGKDAKIEKANGVSYVKSSNYTIAWISNTICFVSGYTGDGSDLIEYFTPKAEKAVRLANSSYDNFMGKPADVHIWTSIGNLVNEVGASSTPGAEQFRDAYNGYRIDFEKGNIAVELEMYSENDELTKSWKEAYKERPDKELIGLIPPDAIALFNTSMDPDVIQRIYRGDLVQSLAQIGMAESLEMGEMMTSFRAMWGGDMMMALTGLDMGSSDVQPDIIVGMSTSNDKSAGELIQELTEAGAIAPGRNKGSYRINDMPFDANLSVEGDKLIAIAGAPSTGDSNLDPQIAKHFRNSPFAFYVDIHRMMDELGKSQGGLAMMMISGFVKSNFDYLMVYAVEPDGNDIAGAAHMDFKFVNEEDYSINVLATLILDFFSSFGGFMGAS